MVQLAEYFVLTMKPRVVVMKLLMMYSTLEQMELLLFLERMELLMFLEQKELLMF